MSSKRDQLTFFILLLFSVISKELPPSKVYPAISPKKKSSTILILLEFFYGIFLMKILKKIKPPIESPIVSAWKKLKKLVLCV